MRRLFKKRRKKKASKSFENVSPNDVFIRSSQFLESSNWKRIRYDALKANDGRCELCARNKHQLPPGEYLNVDHIKPRKTHPELALDIKNLAVICGSCNEGKGNRDDTDWRPASHPHRKA